ncbi:hypothetical protein MOBT1_000354 [Malassezia obtusa]|uniref:Small ribosomal subunit protein mS38 n=1 Tax=Malassezia obtusa TaxID=76774 RepID=A0AAF0E1Z0_9BASI|nr:hypothetical protein MOBT1_000354 [Malassezia obtusa]
MAVRMAQRMAHACGCACLQAPARAVSLARRPPLGMPLQAVPPPTTERSLHLQQLYAQHRPLLEHELLPARPRRLIQRDMVLTEFEEVPENGHWRRSSRGVDSATFNAMLDRLAQLQVAPRAKRMRRQARRATPPTSPVVYAESKRIERMERDADAREEAIANAVERGEDVARAERLGAEAELVVLGEPDGSQKEWGRGVATHLGLHTEPYMPPGARAPRSAYIASVNEEGMHQDAHLWLTHALVQNRVHAARDWDAMLEHLGGADVQMDSVRRKRRKKMNKHKYKKLRKAQRAERQRLKK